MNPTEAEPSDQAPVPSPESPGPQPLTWLVFRARETPRKTLLVSLLLLAILIFIALAYRQPLMVLLAVLVFAVSLNGYFLPTRYTFNVNGITIDKYLFHHSRRWGEFRSFVRTSGGIVLSPFSNWTYLDSFRGIHLLLPTDPGPILTYLVDHLPEKKRAAKSARG